MRVEIEGAGLREYEFRTNAGGEAFFTEMKAQTFFVNTWVDIPMLAVASPTERIQSHSGDLA